MVVLSAERRRVIGEFLRFGIVGTLGFFVDWGVLSIGMRFGTGPWFGRILSYLAAASFTFSANRAWTFRTAERSRSLAQDWSLFLLVNLLGFACNYGTYAALLAAVPLTREFPVIGVAAGSLAGLAGNFLLSKRYIFRGRYVASAAASD
jgi:putative flippase GtrA